MLKPHILILAAGQGKRMHSALPKVLHPVLFHPMLHHVLDLGESIPHSSLSIIVGHGEEQVREACAGYPKAQYFRQTEQKGTAHAVGSASEFLKTVKGQVLILSGDVCLLRKESLEALVKEHESEKASLTLVTTRPENPKGYGRILRGKKGDVVGIREEADASAAERNINEINAGIYCFDIEILLSTLTKISPHNKQGEFYLTDAIEILVKEGKKVVGHEFADPDETLGVNDRVALSLAETILQERTNHALMLKGVTLHQPESILIDPKSEIGPDVEIGPGTQIHSSKIESGATIEGYCRIHHCHIRHQAHIKQGSYLEGSEIGGHASVGPYAHLRPGSVLEGHVKIGNFVEIKKSTFKEGAKAAHLSYIGDAEIGKNSNLGCGFITCNYDGKNKHRTVIGDRVFIGSDSQTVAPVTIGEGSYVASGSTITKDVPPDSLVFSRGHQTTKVGYAKRYHKD